MDKYALICGYFLEKPRAYFSYYLVKLDLTVVSNDDDVFFYFNGINDLEGHMSKGVADFVITSYELC